MEKTSGERGRGKGKAALRRLSGASFTIETALIMPVIIFTLLMSFYFTVHEMNRAVLSLSCGEQAVSGQVQNPQVLFAAGEVSFRRDDSEKERNISVTSGTVKYTGETLFTISESASYEKARPVSRIRKWQALRNMGSGGSR